MTKILTVVMTMMTDVDDENDDRKCRTLTLLERDFHFTKS